jgi:hypothetical protein
MHRRKQELGTNELVPSGARRAGRGFRNTLTVDESIGRCLGSNAVPGGLREYAPGSGEIYPQRGISSKDPDERIQRCSGALVPGCPVHLECLRLFTSPWSKLDQLADAHQPQEAGIWEMFFLAGSPWREGTGKEGGSRIGEPEPSPLCPRCLRRRGR